MKSLKTVIVHYISDEKANYEAGLANGATLGDLKFHIYHELDVLQRWALKNSK